MAVNVMRKNNNNINKRVTDPFNEKIRARIFGSYVSSSSGSEHDGETDVVSHYSPMSPPTPSPSPCLSHLVLKFLEDDSTTTTANSNELTRECGSDSDSDEFVRRYDPTVLIETVINPTVHNNADRYRNKLLNDVVRASEIFAIFRKNKSVFNRNLMAYLREIGYNAGVCKTRWDSCGGLTAGNYEFIDVTHPNSPATRYLIDADFSGEFEIARESVNYEKLRKSLPRVFVAKSDDLKKIVRLMCDEARRSMKSNGLTLPPWRKNRYMQAKWLGPYRRTTNVLPAMTSSSPAMTKFAVKCRSVGFDLAGDKMFVAAPATRTR